MRVALFVEGTNTGRANDPLRTLWSEVICTTLGLQTFDNVVGISKTDIVAMDPDLKVSTSAAGEPLDKKMARHMAVRPFDAAIVAWDLMPAWDPSAKPCRWEETLKIYKHLSQSTALPYAWKEYAQARLTEMSQRQKPSARLAVPLIKTAATLLLCMDRSFESALIDEKAVRDALEVKGQRIRQWPTDWDPNTRDPVRTLQKAILSARGGNTMAGKPAARIRGDMRTAKHEWGAFLFGHQRFRSHVIAHSIGVRARELLGKI